MDVNITEKSNWEKTIDVKLAREELLEDFKKKFDEYKKNIKLEGFRKGKVPLPMIKKIFGKEIESIVAEDKIADVIADISKEHNFSPISPAKVQEFSYNETDGLKFKAVLEVVPEIEIKKHKNLSFEKDVYKVDEEDLDEAMNNLREQHAVMTNIEDDAKPGHHIIADFQKLDEAGIAIIGQKLEDRYYELAQKDSEKKDELTEQLLGLKVGETRNVLMSYTTPEKQQQTDRYAVTMKEIKEKSLPEMDDAFAKDVGDFKSLDELKKQMRENLEKRFEREYDLAFEERIIDEMIKANVFDVPEPMVKNYLDYLVETVGKNQRGRTSDKEMREQYRGEAIRRIKWMMMKEKVTAIEDLKIEDTEIQAHIDNLLTSDEKNKLQIENYYKDDQHVKQLGDELLEQKVFQFLKDNGKIKQNTVTRKDLQKKSKIIE